MLGPWPCRICRDEQPQGVVARRRCEQIPPLLVLHDRRADECLGRFASEEVAHVFPLVRERCRSIEANRVLRVGLRDHVVGALPTEHEGTRQDERLPKDGLPERPMQAVDTLGQSDAALVHREVLRREEHVDPAVGTDQVRVSHRVDLQIGHVGHVCGRQHRVRHGGRRRQRERRRPCVDADRPVVGGGWTARRLGAARCGQQST